MYYVGSIYKRNSGYGQEGAGISPSYGDMQPWKPDLCAIHLQAQLMRWARRQTWILK
jgi:hypothetical protein